MAGAVGGHRTHITERQLDILVALYNSNRPTTEDSTELTDDELHRLTLEVDKRARARWRDMGGYSDPEAGNQAVAAAELGISRQAVSKSLKAVAAALTLTRYIAGVLAPAGTLLNPSAIHAHLDQFDQLRERPDGAAHHSVLTAAAPAVRTTADRGTRVQTALLLNPDHDCLRGAGRGSPRRRNVPGPVDRHFTSKLRQRLRMPHPAT